MEDIREVFTRRSCCVDQLQSRFALSDVNGLEYGLRKLEQFIDVFAAIRLALASNAGDPWPDRRNDSGVSSSDLMSQIDTLVENLRQHSSDVREKIELCQNCFTLSSGTNTNFFHETGTDRPDMM